MAPSPPLPGYAPAVSSYGIPISNVRSGAEDSPTLPVPSDLLTPLRSDSQPGNLPHPATSLAGPSGGGTSYTNRVTTIRPSDTYLTPPGAAQSRSTTSASQRNTEPETPEAASVLRSSTTTRGARARRPQNTNNTMRPVPSISSLSRAPQSSRQPTVMEPPKAVTSKKRKKGRKEQDPFTDEVEDGDASQGQEVAEDEIDEVSSTQKRARHETSDTAIPSIVTLPGATLEHGVTTPLQSMTLPPQQIRPPTFPRLAQPPISAAPLPQAYLSQPAQPAASMPHAQAHPTRRFAPLHNYHADPMFQERHEAERQRVQENMREYQQSRADQRTQAEQEAILEQQKMLMDRAIALVQDPLMKSMLTLGEEQNARPLRRLAELILNESCRLEGPDEQDFCWVYDPFAAIRRGWMWG